MESGIRRREFLQGGAGLALGASIFGAGCGVGQETASKKATTNLIRTVRTRRATAGLLGSSVGPSNQHARRGLGRGTGAPLPASRGPPTPGLRYGLAPAGAVGRGQPLFVLAERPVPLRRPVHCARTACQHPRRLRVTERSFKRDRLAR